MSTLIIPNYSNNNGTVRASSFSTNILGASAGDYYQFGISLSGFNTNKIISSISASLTNILIGYSYATFSGFGIAVVEIDVKDIPTPSLYMRPDAMLSSLPIDNNQIRFQYWSRTPNFIIDLSQQPLKSRYPTKDMVCVIGVGYDTADANFGNPAQRFYGSLNICAKKESVDPKNDKPGKYSLREY